MSQVPGVPSLVTASGSEPLTLDEVKAHLRVDDTEEDGLIIGKLIAAREIIESRTGRALVTQTIDWWLPCFPVDRLLTLPRAPLQSVSSLKYVDAAGTEQTFASSNYFTVSPAGPTAAPGWIELVDGGAWPTHYLRTDAVRIRFVAGYSGPENVPDALRSALKLVIGDLYENREAQLVGDSYAPNPTVEALIAPFKLWKF